MLDAPVFDEGPCGRLVHDIAGIEKFKKAARAGGGDDPHRNKKAFAVSGEGSTRLNDAL
jgi:hypothetical protein